eukprot:1141444-Pelagomonas_calceolata.AAC.1
MTGTLAWGLLTDGTYDRMILYDSHDRHSCEGDLGQHSQHSQRYKASLLESNVLDNLLPSYDKGRTLNTSIPGFHGRQEACTSYRYENRCDNRCEHALPIGARKPEIEKEKLNQHMQLQGRSMPLLTSAM